MILYRYHTINLARLNEGSLMSIPELVSGSPELLWNSPYQCRLGSDDNNR